MAFETYDVALALLGVVFLGVSFLPRYVSERPISMPLFFTGFGVVVFSLPSGLPSVDPVAQGAFVERLAELGVIVALMTAGLKIDRELGFRAWGVTWRLLAVTMPVTILVVAALGATLAGLMIPAAVLLGACVAPTDPVLASEVQVEGPGEGREEVGEASDAPESAVSFALTSEASLNDGLAFPYTNLAILMVVVGVSPSAWAAEWVLVDVAYRIVTGVAVGALGGVLLARLMFHTVPEGYLAGSVQGFEAIAGTLLIYGGVEYVGGYGFLAVISASLAIRQYERGHGYNEELHRVSELSEQAFLGLLMFLFGGALAGGLLGPLMSWSLVAIVALTVFVVRPLAGGLALVGGTVPSMGWFASGVVAFFGVRGIATFYYLAHGLEEAAFGSEEVLWALAGGIVLVSLVVHGVLATPVTERLEA